MTFTWDFNTATLLGILGQAVLLIVYLVKTANTAKAAMKRADEAHRHADGAHEKSAALSGLLALHREQVAREYVDKAALREMEGRLTDRIDRVGDHLAALMERGGRKT